MNKGLKIYFIVGIIFVLLLLVRDQVIKHVVVSMAKEIAGVNVTIGDLKLGLMNQSMKIKDLKVYNPSGFPSDKVMLDIPEIAIKVDAPSFFSNTLHVPYIRFDLKEARVIRNKEGLLNVSSLPLAMPPSSDKKLSSSSSPSTSSSTKQMKMRFDVVSLNIGTIYIEDYTSGKEKPKLTVANLNMHEREFKDVVSVEDLAGLVMFQALLPVGLNGDILSKAALSGVEAPLVNAIDGLFKRR